MHLADKLISQHRISHRPLLPKQAAQVDAQNLAAAMAAIHGGLWKAVVDHEAGFILIRPVLDQLPLS